MTNRMRLGYPALAKSIALLLALLVVAVGRVRVASAEDAPPPPLSPFFERMIPGLKEERETLPPFLRDADFTLHLRTYYFNRTKPDDSVNEALAFGGWIGVKSGWLLDTLACGARVAVLRGRALCPWSLPSRSGLEGLNNHEGLLPVEVL